VIEKYIEGKRRKNYYIGRKTICVKRERKTTCVKRERKTTAKRGVIYSEGIIRMNRVEKNIGENRTKKFLCMYLYKELCKYDEIQLDKESNYITLLNEGKVVHTEKIIPGQVIKHSIHIDYMIVEAKNVKEAKEKLVKGCNFQILCSVCEEADMIMRLFRKGTKTII